jgi:GntR family mannosyl-D-glycerate transport/metabolism transcriptional repressor
VRTPDPRAYMRLAALLRDQITPGERLPPIGELRRKHGHSRQTVAKAMRVLQDEDLIYRVPGLGYYAAEED